jgi:hypothetical protein
VILGMLAGRTDKVGRRMAPRTELVCVRIVMAAFGTFHGSPHTYLPFLSSKTGGNWRLLSNFAIWREKKAANLSTGGREGIRTLDLSVANAALSQLSYAPINQAYLG